MKEYVQEGNEKWRKWARNRLRALRSFREDLRLPQMQKSWVIDSTTIHVRSSEFGDTIMILGGSWDFYTPNGYTVGADTWFAFLDRDNNVVKKHMVGDALPVGYTYTVEFVTKAVNGSVALITGHPTNVYYIDTSGDIHEIACVGAISFHATNSDVYIVTQQTTALTLSGGGFTQTDKIQIIRCRDGYTYDFVPPRNGTVNGTNFSSDYDTAWTYRVTAAAYGNKLCVFATGNLQAYDSDGSGGASDTIIIGSGVAYLITSDFTYSELWYQTSTQLDRSFVYGDTNQICVFGKANAREDAVYQALYAANPAHFSKGKLYSVKVTDSGYTLFLVDSGVQYDESPISANPSTYRSLLTPTKFYIPSIVRSKIYDGDTGAVVQTVADADVTGLSTSLTDAMWLTSSMTPVTALAGDGTTTGSGTNYACAASASLIGVYFRSNRVLYLSDGTEYTFTARGSGTSIYAGYSKDNIYFFDNRSTAPQSVVSDFNDDESITAFGLGVATPGPVFPAYDTVTSKNVLVAVTKEDPPAITLTKSQEWTEPSFVPTVRGATYEEWYRLKQLDNWV